MASSPAPPANNSNNNESYSSTSPPLPVDSGGPGSRSYTPALLDMFNKSSSSSSSKNNNKNTTSSTNNSNDDDATHHRAMMNNNHNPLNNGVVSRGGAPNSDSKPPRHASFNFQIQSKQNNNNNQIGNSSESSPLQPLPLIKDQLQVVEVTRNGRTRKVCFLFAFSSFFLSSTLTQISLLKTIY